jgi:hypothetical protein
MPFKRSFDFSHFVQKILLYPNSEQTSAKPASASRGSLLDFRIFLTSFKRSFFIRIPNKPAQSLPALRVVHCSTSGFFSLRSKDPSLSEFRTNQRKACQRFALLSFFMPTPL